MARAGIFIGVDRTGGLQKLGDAAAGARRMYDWALAQGMPEGTHAKLITDADGAKVTPDMIYDAVKEIIDGPGVDQLILYFAGHGVNISRGEHWLLTDAPVRTSAAVNVSGSVELARYCGIQHVVVISDACRVAPEGIQAQNVRGVDVFPNDGAGDRAKPVDQFFACFLGKTAAELRDPAVAASNYTALYTSALLDALRGAAPDVLEDSGADDDDFRYVRPRKLQSFLEAEVPRRVKAMRLEQKVNQNPDAIITSDATWLARLELPTRAGGPRFRRRGSKRPAPPPAPPDDLRSLTQRLVRSASEGDHDRLQRELADAREGIVEGGAQLAGTMKRLATPFGPDQVATESAIKVRGARVADLFARRASVERLGDDEEGEVIGVGGLGYEAASVLLEFEGDVGSVIPAIPGFIAALTFEDGELVDVAYEPAADNPRWTFFEERAAEVRALRAVAASSSQHGRFRLEQPDAINVAKMMQYAKGVDPTLAIYAAYAYHDLHAIDRIRQMSGYLRDDVGSTFFDLALLARQLVDRPIAPNDRIVPFVPLLSQGWALLGAHRVKLHAALAGLERSVRDSLWSLYDAAGLKKLRQAMNTGEVR